MKLTLENLQENVNDERIKVSEHNGMYFAEVVESNGDVHDLAQSKTLEGLKTELKSMAYLSEV